jgi:hypothetical protein
MFVYITIHSPREGIGAAQKRTTCVSQQEQTNANMCVTRTNKNTHIYTNAPLAKQLVVAETLDANFILRLMLLTLHTSVLRLDLRVMFLSCPFLLGNSGGLAVLVACRSCPLGSLVRTLCLGFICFRRGFARCFRSFALSILGKTC